MANVKTAISLQKTLFEQVDSLARQRKISRSRLFALALEEYLQRQQSQQLLDQINAVYAAPPEAAERKRAPALRRQHRNLVEGEW